ncbi:MAG: sugar porter family MFS transporter, partial [Thermoguttaceae bacterium]
MSNSNRGSLLFVLFATCVAATGGFLFGYDTAVINGANSYIKAHWTLSEVQEGLVGASAILGCIPGAMFAGVLSDRFGRKRMLFLCAILYGLSAVLFLPTLSPNLNQFLVARFICGLGIGASSMICPVYIAELAPEKWRGRLGTLFQLGIVVGILITLFVNKTIQGFGNDAWNSSLGWRWMLGIGAVPAVFFILLLLGVPESPRWLAQNNREEEARQILSRAAGAIDADKQMTEIREAIGQEEGRFSELFGGVYFRPLVLAVVLMLCSQFCGINAILYYSTDIFKTAGADNAAAFTATAWIGVINLLATLVAIALVDKLGRRPLLLLGAVVQTFALGMIGWMFFAKVSGSEVPAGLVGLFQLIGSMVDPQQAALFGCIITFTAAFAVSIG